MAGRRKSKKIRFPMIANMSLLGRKRSQEGLEFVGEESRWGSPLGRLPEIEVLEDLLNHAALLDHCDDSKPAATLGTFQSVDFIHLAKQPCPAAPGIAGRSARRLRAPPSPAPRRAADRGLGRDLVPLSAGNLNVRF